MTTAGLGKVERAILAALAERHRRIDDSRVLATHIYGTNPPTEAQRVSVRRAIHSLERKGLVTTRRRTRRTLVRAVDVVPTPDGGERKVRRGLTVGLAEMTVVSLVPDPTVCRGCGAPLEQPAVGRRRVWCSDACRWRGSRSGARRARARASADD